MAQKVTFTIEGEFITNTARDWFFREHKPYSVVEEFLLSCMLGTSLGQEELRLMAQDVILGRAQFIGNQRDNTYNYVEDNKPYIAFEHMDQIHSGYDEARGSTEDMTAKYLDLVNAIKNESIESTEFGDNRQLLIDHCIDFNGVLDARADASTSRRSNGCSPILDSFLEAHRFDDNYGWLAPDGTFTAIEWGDHTEWAFKKIKKEKWLDDFYGNAGTVQYSAGDYLCSRGWILLHNPLQGMAMPTMKEGGRITKPQRNFLFDYYTERNRNDLAAQYLDAE